MKGNYSDRFFSSNLSLIGLLLLVITPFLLIALYNHASADDYCFAVRSQQHGFWQSQAIWYNSWTGRFFSTALLSLNPLVYGAFGMYKLVPIVLILSFLFALWVLINRVFPALSFKSKFTVLFFASFLYFLHMPNIVDGIYWMAGAVTYQLACILCIVFAFVFIHYFGITNRFLKLISFFSLLLVGMAIVGSNETTMFLLMVFLIGYVSFLFWKNKKLKIDLLLLLSLLAIGSFLVISAPGNNLRGTNFQKTHLVLRTVAGSVFYTFYFLLKWLPSAILVFLFFSKEFNRLANYVREKYQLNLSILQYVILVILSFSLIVLCFIPGFWSLGSCPPLRTVNVIYLVFIFEVVILFVLGYPFLSEYQLFHKIISVRGRIIVGIILVAIIVFTNNNIKNVYFDLISGKASKYNTEMESRMQLVVKSKNDTCLLVPLQNIPKTIFFTDLTGDATDWRDACFSAYFELKSIRLQEQ